MRQLVAILIWTAEVTTLYKEVHIAGQMTPANTPAGALFKDNWPNEITITAETAYLLNARCLGVDAITICGLFSKIPAQI